MKIGQYLRPFLSPKMFLNPSGVEPRSSKFMNKSDLGLNFGQRIKFLC